MGSRQVDSQPLGVEAVVASTLFDEEKEACLRGLIPRIRFHWDRVDFLIGADRMEEEGYDLLADYFRDVASYSVCLVRS